MGMDTYEWQKNHAVVQRMFYAENCVKFSFLGAAGYTAFNMVMIRNNYNKIAATASLFPVWKRWVVLNAVVVTLLLRPLTRFEIEQQWRKRVYMGKYLFTLYHLETPEEMAFNKAAGYRCADIKAEGDE